MILIAGDSWGCGEWARIGDSDYGVIHEGLCQYLRDKNYSAINLSNGGTSNWDTYETIKSFFDSGAHKHLSEPLKLILVFQTEWIRDLRDQTEPTCVHGHDKIEAITCWQHRLSEIATKHNIKIGLIGGCSDTLCFDNFEKEHPNLFIACQSFTNLCINNEHKIEDPIFFVRSNDNLLHKAKQHYKKYSSKEELTNDLEKGMYRLDTWKNNKQWFYPDGLHANRHAHKKLFDFLSDRKII